MECDICGEFECDLDHKDDDQDDDSWFFDHDEKG